jgi:predicted XRE-type DNA-binding protein
MSKRLKNARVGRPGKKIYAGSGNVFADLGFPDAVALNEKTRLAVMIQGIVAERGLSRASVAQRLNLNARQVAGLVVYRLESFTLPDMMRFVRVLGGRIPRESGKRLGVLGGVAPGLKPIPRRRPRGAP